MDTKTTSLKIRTKMRYAYRRELKTAGHIMYSNMLVRLEWLTGQTDKVLWGTMNEWVSGRALLEMLAHLRIALVRVGTLVKLYSAMFIVQSLQCLYVSAKCFFAVQLLLQLWFNCSICLFAWVALSKDHPLDHLKARLSPDWWWLYA